mgnify:CR=1 FL=1
MAAPEHADCGRDPPYLPLAIHTHRSLCIYLAAAGASAIHSLWQEAVGGGARLTVAIVYLLRQEAGLGDCALAEHSAPDLYGLELECRRAQEREEFLSG